MWVSRYYAHGDMLETLAQRDALSEPRPSVENMSLEDLLQNVYGEAAQPDGMDLLLVYSSSKQGTFDRLHEATLFPSQGTASDKEWGNLSGATAQSGRSFGALVDSRPRWPK